MFCRKALPPVGYSIRGVVILAGGREAVCEALGIHSCRWKTIPDKHVRKVSEMCGIPISELRPDLVADDVIY